MTNESTEKIGSFLKWPGGKRWFVSKYSKVIPTNYNKYIEPFLGSGSVFFYLKPAKAIISDINHELINVFMIMRDYPSKIRTHLLNHQKNHSHEYYYLVRSNKSSDEIENAARFLYLNRTCFNGMYRVNREGLFNVPLGTKKNFIYDIDVFDVYADILRNADIQAVDFEQTLKKSEKNDLVFVDPPYTVSHNQNSFIKYNEKLFSWQDQERLAKNLLYAKERGSIILSTNANYKKLRDLYQSYGFYTRVVIRYSSISGKAENRKIQEELVITTISNLEGNNVYKFTD